MTLPEHPQELSKPEAIKAFATDEVLGLGQAEVERRQLEFGPNLVETQAPLSPWLILLRQFKDLMVLILLVASVVAFASWWAQGAEGVPADAMIILVIVIANGLLGFAQEYGAEKTIRSLRASTQGKARVIRDGAAQMVDFQTLVPGDLVVCSEGDLVPADALLLKATHFRVNESMLTGESVPVSKSPAVVDRNTPLDSRVGELFAGTTIVAGESLSLVCRIGGNTKIGQIAQVLESTVSDPTPLELRLDQLGKQIGWGVLILSILIAGVVLVVEGRADSATLFKVSLFGVALAVAAIPEGLPAVLTVSLSAGARRLAEQNVACRKMAAVETLGSVTRIVTDKTGTLTKNEMTVRRVFDGRHYAEVSGSGYASEGQISNRDVGLEDLVLSAVLANSGSLETDASGKRLCVGDPMDGALLVLSEKSGLDWESSRAVWERVSEAPFSSERARVSALCTRNGQSVLYVKGSLDSVAALARPEDGRLLEALRNAEKEFAKDSLRTLAFARRKGLQVTDSAEESESELELLGLIAFEDPPREGVAEAIERCHRAGIKVSMCTGDHSGTALAVAERIGLCSEEKSESSVVTGPEFSRMDSAARQACLESGTVFARFSPEDKLSLVDSLLASGEVVAMTGDGVNDAPALKRVHVGVAMGRSGTAVAIEASDIVLTNDHFSTIVQAIEEGRSVFGNIQRFIAFLFSGNFGVVLAMFVGTVAAGVFGIRYAGEILLPLTAAQILWMNLVNDGAPAVAFALGKNSSREMNTPPRDPSEPILDRNSWQLVCATGAVVALVFLLVLDGFFTGGVLTVLNLDPIYARTLAFYTLVTARLANAFNFVDLRRGLLLGGAPVHRSLVLAVLCSAAMNLAVVTSELGARFFGLQALLWNHWLPITVLVPPLVVGVGEILKWLIVRPVPRDA